MLALAKLSIRRPKPALAAWLLVGVILAVIGFGATNTLSPSISTIPSTQSSTATNLATARFGPTQLVPILIEGPKAQLNAVGPKLVAALVKRPHTRALSAWDAGSASTGLRPNPNAAMIVVSIDRTEANAVKYDEPQIESLVAHYIKAPVKSYISGQPSIDRAERSAAVANLRRNELLAIGILFVLLLVGLRAPVAAVITTAVGAISMLAGFGEVALLGHVMQLDPIGMAAGTMTGLALGVGFALLILDRFHREEFPPGTHSRDAATAAIRGLDTTGRAVLVSGTAIILALALVAAVGPMQLMVSVGAATVASAAFATGGAVVVMPAALVLLGRRIDLLRVPAPAPLARAWSLLVAGGNAVTQHALYAGFAAIALLAVLAIPALSLKSGPADVRLLPSNAKARIAFTEISRVMGQGWATPFDIVVAPRNRPVTTPAFLTAISNFQNHVAKDYAVYSVTGPGQINSTSDQLKAFGPSLAKSAKISDQSKKQLLLLINGLGQAGAGSKQLQSGLAAASSGAGQLQGGAGQAQAGAGELHAGLAQAQSGSSQVSNGLNQALAGANALKTGAGEALTGANQLVQGLGMAQGPASESLPALNGLNGATGTTSSQISAAAGTAGNAKAAVGNAIAALGSLPKSTPGYLAALAALENASGAVQSTSDQIGAAAGQAQATHNMAGMIAYQAPGLIAAINMAHDGASQLASAIQQLENGNAQLASGVGQLAGGGGQLTSGLGQLTNGAGQLQTGLALLDSGAGQLASGLSGGVGPAGQLVTGLGQMQAAVAKSRGQIPSTASLKLLMKEAPGLFSSGYFVLAAVDGAQPADRNAASFMLNLDQGATAGQIVVVSRYGVGSAQTDALRRRLTAEAQTFARQNNAVVAVGGPAGQLLDLTNVTQGRVWVDVAVIALSVTLVLAVALRAVLLPIAITLRGLLVTAATFGILELLFGGNKPALGGPGFMDPRETIDIFCGVFAITITFSTLLVMRSREEFVAHGDVREAVRIGLRETAAAATGAGIVMIAALIPFSATQLINLRGFGIGIAIAVLLDVVIVRPVLLPAAEVVLGRAGWWPTKGPRTPQSPAEESSTETTRRLPRLPVPHRRPRPAHQ